ncbi:atrial natriuretic peptide-converting enzyme-like [Gigantopelta aegis]|uniref:atrial natriuretic peptide-converting enzyme-like n=1 Tax=Gigantopelta aegis TaxID=1735272 RepID=UPI001B88BB57|nr:atrial natriuretic peptide-converting enzyme-like [Gigantopelta aegis]
MPLYFYSLSGEHAVVPLHPLGGACRCTSTPSRGSMPLYLYSLPGEHATVPLLPPGGACRCTFTSSRGSMPLYLYFFPGPLRQYIVLYLFHLCILPSVLYLHNNKTCSLSLCFSPGSIVVSFLIHLRKAVDVDSLNNLSDILVRGLTNSIITIDNSSIRIHAEVPHSTISPVRPSPSETCEPLRLLRCVNRTDYQNTAFPNALGDTSQDQAIARYRKYDLYFELKCHGYATDFYCSAYTPECRNNRAILPCRSYCEEVKKRCKEYPKNVSFPVDCSKLPDSDDPAICRPSPYKPGKCVEVEFEYCRELDFNSTSFPNIIGSTAESEVSSMLNLMKGIQDATKCYKHSMMMGCSAFLPHCTGTERVPGNYIPPCKSLCKAYKDRCEIFLNIFYHKWPNALNCESLPDSSDPSVCTGYKEAHEPPEFGDCKPGELRCDVTSCIKPAWVCDGYQDCRDNADEKHCAFCKSHEYQCSPTSLLCINKTSVCDGVNDCYEGVDEQECVRLKGSPQENLLEVYNPPLDRWETVCDEGWNTTFSQIVCKQLGYSSSYSTITEMEIGQPTVVVADLQRGKDPTQIQSYIQSGHFCASRKHVKIVCKNPICGVRPAHYREPLRIVGGDEVKPGTWPWLVSLQGGSGGTFFCGGSVINEQWILTAAHCVGGGGTSRLQWKIMAGHTRRLTYTKYRQIRKGKKFFTYPRYDTLTVDNDIALIKLDRPLVFTNYLRPVCLPKADLVTKLGTRCIAAGWGKTGDYALDYQPAVLQVQLDIANWNACKAAVESSEQQVPYKLTHNMMCAGGGLGHDACGGDSGGPFVCHVPNTTDTWYQAGIVSWGIGCAVPHSPGIYTKLPNYIDWINEVIANNTDS